MSIVSYNVLTTGTIGVSPRIVQIVSTDNLATITAAGYFNKLGQVLEGLSLSPTDCVLMIYSYVATTNSGSFGIFNPSISNGIITLVQWANPGDVLLPVTSGDVAIFNGTSGQIKDSGAAPSALAEPFVVMSPGSITAGHLLKANDANGTIADQGVAMKSVAQAAVAGGAAAQTVTDAFCTTGACVIATWNDTTNAVEIEKVAAGNGSFVVTSTADPGASHLNYVIFK